MNILSNTDLENTLTRAENTQPLLLVPRLLRFRADQTRAAVCFIEGEAHLCDKACGAAASEVGQDVDLCEMECFEAGQIVVGKG